VVQLTGLKSNAEMNPSNVEINPPISPLGTCLLVRGNEARTLHAFGHAIVVLLDGKQTDEKSTAFLNMTPVLRKK